MVDGMPEAPRERPEKHTVLHTFVAHITADQAVVFSALERRMDPGPMATNGFLADPGDLLIVMQGAWWYRGEYRVVPYAAGSNLEHVIVNVAQRAERAALVAGRRVIQSAPIAFHDLVKSLRGELE